MTVWTFAMWSLLAWSGPWEAHGDVGPFPTRESCQVARETVYALQDPYQRSEEHTSELQSPCNLVCRLLLEKKKKKKNNIISASEKARIAARSIQCAKAR